MSSQNINRNHVVVVSVIIAISFLYYFAIYLPKQNEEKEKKHQEEIKKIKDQKGLELWESNNEYENCKDWAYVGYLKQWRMEEEARGLPRGSSLPLALAENMENSHQKKQEQCLNEYKIKLETLEKQYPGVIANPFPSKL